jgi:hypothetical protein
MTFNHIVLLVATPFVAVLYVSFLMWLDERSFRQRGELQQLDGPRRGAGGNPAHGGVPSGRGLSS